MATDEFANQIPLFWAARESGESLPKKYGKAYQAAQSEGAMVGRGYQALGFRIKESNGNRAARAGYDPLGRLILEVNPELLAAQENEAQSYGMANGIYSRINIAMVAAVVRR